MWLRLVSDARPSKLFTANGEIFLSRTGHLYTQKIREILQRVEILFTIPTPRLLTYLAAVRDLPDSNRCRSSGSGLLAIIPGLTPLLIRPGILARVLTVSFGVHYLASRRLGWRSVGFSTNPEDRSYRCLSPDLAAS